MGKRFDVGFEEGGWTVFDVFTGQPVVIMDVPQIGLQFQDACDLAELLHSAGLSVDRRLRQ